MSISSKGPVDKKPCLNFSNYSKSSMASHISFVVDRYCFVRCRNHLTFFCTLIGKLHRQAELWKRLHRHGYKSILDDDKKVVACKIFSQQALGAPMLLVGRGVG
jgi:hypothetical protein